MGSNPISSDSLNVLIKLIKFKMFFYIKISAKEKKILQNFLVFFSKFKFCFIKINQKSAKKTHKFVTVLKSPHINKTAQEQFEFKFFTRHILLISKDLFLSFFILKQVVKSVFPGIKIKLMCIFDKKKHNKILLSILDPSNIYLKKNDKIENYLQMFDCYGELSLRNKLQ